MRILLLTQYFWPESFRINELACSLVEQGHSVTVLTGKPNYPEGQIFPGYKALGVSREVHCGIKIVRMPLIPRGVRNPFQLALNYLSFILSGYLIAPIALRKEKFDVVFVYAPSPLLQALPAVMLAKLKRAPLAVWVQDLWPESLSATGHLKNKLVLKLVAGVVKHIYRHTDSILIQSQAFKPAIEQLTGPCDRIEFYPNSAESIFHSGPTSASAATGALAEQIKQYFSIVFAGNIGSAQSVETIIQAAATLKDHKHIHFFLIGSGSQTSLVETEIKRLNLENVTLPGRFAVSEMPSLFRAASALLVTLKDEAIFRYTIPAKIQSYLAVGKPIVGALNGEGARIIEEAQAGVTCPAENAQVLAEAILSLSKMQRENLNQLGVNAKNYFSNHFESQKLTQTLIDHLHQTLSKHKAKP